MMTSEFIRRPLISKRVDAIPASGIRRFFDIIATMDDVISLGVGEPDFVTPEQIREAAIRSIKQGHTHYTSNFGMIQLREAIARDLERRFDVSYDPATELMCVAGVSEALGVTFQAILDPFAFTASRSRRASRAFGTAARTSSSTRWVPTPRCRIRAEPQCGQAAGARGSVRPQR